MADAVNGTRTPLSQTCVDPSRRTILAGLPAAAVGVVALTAPALAAAAHPDAALLALEPEFKVLKAQDKIACDACGEAEGKYFDEIKKLPWARRKRKAERDRLKAKYNVDAAEKASDDAGHRLHARLEDLVNGRAKTLDGLKFKARWAEQRDDIPLSIIEDLLAM